jgi:hypothetical protein
MALFHPSGAHWRPACVLLAAAIVLAAPRASGQAGASDELPGAREIVDRAIAALGGEDAVRRHSSRRALGRFEMPGQGLEGTLEMLTAAPDRLVVTISLPGLGELVTGFDGEVAWSINPLTGPMLLEGRQLEQMRLDADFFAVLQAPSRHRTIEVVERTDFGGRSCYKLRITRHGGEQDYEFYDAETGLPAGSILSRDSPMGPLTATTVLEDYRSFDGVLMASRAIQRSLGVEQRLIITSVEHDTLDTTAFAPPAAIKALLAAPDR